MMLFVVQKYLYNCGTVIMHKNRLNEIWSSFSVITLNDSLYNLS